MPEQPSGTVTLVFTDIEGSTRLLHELGQDGYRDALAEHRRIVREAFAAGYEVDYEGDAFFYAFASAVDAVAAVARAMAGLEGGPVRIRVGLNTGEPGLDPPKYVGVDVHLAARVMSVGHGGQVLLSRSTRDLVDVELKDLGEHRLKDIVDPVWLYQLGDGDFAPLKSLNNTNLPTPASSFLGREPELEQAGELLSGSRLLTISGPGGAGKTRFAIELASRQLARFPNGVFWVPLAALRDPGLVVSTIAESIGSRNGLAEHIGARSMLLVLDNFEQVVDAAPELPDLLTTCPGLSLLVTSRELLRVQGEVDFSLPPLKATEAVQLFCVRARCRPDEHVEELCRRLEGLPLAIELAAARMSAFTPGQLLERLGERLDFLKGGRDADPRQQTLRATIQWSYDLLDDREASLLRRLAVFAGGCVIDDAEHVLGADVDALQSLVEKSLVRRADERLWILETIREFALDELEARGELEAARSVYFDWLLRLVEGAEDELAGGGQPEWLQRLYEEHGNIREVVTLALDASDGELALGVLAPLYRYWVIRPGEGAGWFERGLDLVDQVPPRLAARALLVGAVAALFAEESDELVLQRCRESLLRFEELGDEAGIADACAWLSNPLGAMGRLREAEELIERAVEIQRRLGLEAQLALSLQGIAWYARWRGDDEQFAEVMAESTALARKVGDQMLASRNILSLGGLKIDAGDLEEGMELTREALQMVWEIRHLMDVAMCLANLARVLAARGDTRRAAVLWGAAARLNRELGRTQMRTEIESAGASLPPDVLADEEGLRAGKEMTTVEAVEFGLQIS